MHRKVIWRRLLPLYISSLLQGLVFWYAIEKVFMVHIGFTATTIAAQVIVMSLTGLLLETPAGILADRWSRKGVLVLACMALAVASLLLGLSHSVTGYLLASVLYGVYFSLHSGTYDAMIYDTLIEEQSSRTGYEKYLGNVMLFESVGLVTGSLLGGVIGSKFGLSTAYFSSVPAGALAAIAAFGFIEPTLHKAEEQTGVLRHAKDTMRAVFQKGAVLWILVALLATSVVYEFLIEVDQLWPLALKMHLLWYGPLNALLLLGYGLGGPLAAVIIKRRAFLPLVYLVSLVVVGLLVIRNMPVVAFAQFCVIALYIALYTIALGKLHDALPPRLRSGSSSAVGTLTNLVFIPLVFAFGWLTQRYTVFHAAYLLVPLAVLGILATFIILRHAVSGDAEIPLERVKTIPNATIGQ